MKFSHEDSYDPPFPAIEIILHNSEEGFHTDAIRALLDTGSDGSLVPLDYLRQTFALPLTDTRIRSHWGEWRTVQLFAVDIELNHLNFKFPGIFVVGDDQGNEVILGRNVLNKLRLFLDGPGNFTDVPSQ